MDLRANGAGTSSNIGLNPEAGEETSASLVANLPSAEARSWSEMD